MGQGFYTVNGANGNVVSNSDTTLLFHDDIYIATGTTVVTIPGAAGRTARVVQSGVSNMNTTATVSQANAGANLAVTITVQRNGYFFIILEGAPTGNYGIQLANDSGIATISSEVFGYAFVGNAVYQGVAQADSYSQIGSPAFGFVVGVSDKFYQYIVTSPVAPLCFIQAIGNTSYFRVCSVRNLNASQWEIIVGGNNWTTAPIIKCFSKLQGPGGGGYGMRLFNSAGQRTWDTTAQMLSVSTVFDWAAVAANNTSLGIVQSVTHSISNPYVMSLVAPTVTGMSSTTQAGIHSYRNNEYISGFALDGTTLRRTSRAIKSDAYDDDFGYNNNFLLDDRTYLINGNFYT